jgi:hypothetical protein
MLLLNTKRFVAAAQLKGVHTAAQAKCVRAPAHSKCVHTAA